MALFADFRQKRRKNDKRENQCFLIFAKNFLKKSGKNIWWYGIKAVPLHPLFEREPEKTPEKGREERSLKSFPYRRSSTRAALPCVLSGAGYPVSLSDRLAQGRVER